MRTILAPLIPFVVWLGILQLPVRTLDLHPADTTGGMISVAAALTGLTVAVYRLGIWREQMNITKQNVTAEVARHREEANQHFANIEHRLASIERHISGVVEQRASLERWQGRVDTVLEAHGRRIDTLAAQQETAA